MDECALLSKCPSYEIQKGTIVSISATILLIQTYLILSDQDCINAPSSGVFTIETDTLTSLVYCQEMKLGTWSVSMKCLRQPMLTCIKVWSDFHLSSLDRDMPLNVWNRLLGSSLVDMGDLIIHYEAFFSRILHDIRGHDHKRGSRGGGAGVRIPLEIC